MWRIPRVAAGSVSERAADFFEKRGRAVPEADVRPMSIRFKTGVHFDAERLPTNVEVARSRRASHRGPIVGSVQGIRR